MTADRCKNCDRPRARCLAAEALLRRHVCVVTTGGPAEYERLHRAWLAAGGSLRGDR